MPIFKRCAYLRVFKVWSAEEDPGLIQAIMTILEFPGSRKESRSTIVSLEARKGTWELRVSRALIHSLSASRLLLISAPSIRLYRLLLWQSAARSDPAKSTINSLPAVLPEEFLTLIWQTACDREDVSLAVVARVVLAACPLSMIVFISLALEASFSVRPLI